MYKHIPTKTITKAEVWSITATQGKKKGNARQKGEEEDVTEKSRMT